MHQRNTLYTVNLHKLKHLFIQLKKTVRTGKNKTSPQMWGKNFNPQSERM